MPGVGRGDAAGPLYAVRGQTLATGSADTDVCLQGGGGGGDFVL